MASSKDDDDEFGFDDDDLDLLPANTLQQLEASAFLSTQHQDTRPALNQSVYVGEAHVTRNQNNNNNYNQNRFQARPESDYGDEEIINLNEESLPRVQVLDSNAHTADSFPALASQWNTAPAPQYAEAPGFPHQPPSQYYAQDESYNQNYNAGPYTESNNAAPYNEGYNAAPYSGTYNGASYNQQPTQAARPTQVSQVDVNHLLSRIKKLEQEKVRLKREMQAEKSKVMSKSGEADIVRRRLEAAKKEHERKIALMQQAHIEAVAKQKAELEKIRRDRELMETNNLFLEHDLAREADKAKRRGRNPAPNKAKANNISPEATPKKQKHLPFRDGFDDDDIIMLSPSKNRDRGKAQTPKQGAKRKRQIVDQSPIPALQLSELRERMKPPETTGPTAPQLDPSILERLRKEDHRFELLHRLVNHRSSNGHDRVLEALTQHVFPSNPSKKLSSILFDEIADCGFEDDVHVLAIKFCHVFLSLWDQCLKETYYAPLYLILDGLQFILACEPSSTAVALTSRALPLIIASIDLVAVPIARASTNPSFIETRDSPAQMKLRQEIDVLECLNLLHAIATSCVTSSEAITRFWQNLPNDFILVMLMKAQPLPQIMLMLRILSTSSLPNTLGAIVPADSAPDQQAKRESDIINRLTNLLFETPHPLPPIPPIPSTNTDTTNTTPPPIPPAQPPSYTPNEILTLRLTVLNLLTTFSITPRGSHTLAHDRHLLTRLIRHLSTTLSSLYTSTSGPNFTTLHAPTIASINTSMRLLHRLLVAHPDVDIKARLSGVQGGSHKYLTSLTRLAFMEGLVFEDGIVEDVVDAAHGVLDEGLSPEEGEGLLRAFCDGSTGVGLGMDGGGDGGGVEV